MKRLRIAAVIMIIHGLLELCGLIPAVLANHLPQLPPIFALDFFKQNLALMGVMGAIFGIVRIVAAVKIWRNQMSGFVLGVIMGAVTLALMVFMIPSGIMDGVLAGAALIVLLDGYFTSRKIVGTNRSAQSEGSD